jgi:hypothetical protein
LQKVLVMVIPNASQNTSLWHYYQEKQKTTEPSKETSKKGDLVDSVWDIICEQMRTNFR